MSKLAVILVDDIYEDLELHYPRLRLIEEGFQVQLVGNEKKVFVRLYILCLLPIFNILKYNFIN